MEKIDVQCARWAMESIETLKPHPKNPNKHSPDQINTLARLIEHHGFRHPIIISRLSNYIVAGHGRLEAAKKLGMPKVPVDYQDFKNAEAEYSFLVSDNAIAGWAELDFKEINLAISDLGPDLDLSLLAIPNFTVDVSEKEQKPPLTQCPQCGHSFSLKKKR